MVTSVQPHGIGRYWTWLAEDLGLTFGGRIAFTIVGVVLGGAGLAGTVADAILGGVHGDQEAGVLLVFSAIAVAFALGLVTVFDRGLRELRERLRKVRSKSG